MQQPTKGEPTLRTATDGTSRISRRGLRTFSSLKNPVYRLYFGSLLGQMAAMNMQMMAGSLLIYRLSGSAAILGLLSIAHAVPQLVLGVFGGALADRIQKKYALLADQIISAVVALGVALALTTGYMSQEHAGSWWVLIAAAIIQGSVMSLTMPSRQAIIREIVSQEQLMNAVALANLGMNTFRLIAPALAGFLIDAFGFKTIYFTMTGLYLVAIIFIVLLPRTSRIATTLHSPLADIGAGFKYIRGETTILSLIIFSLFVVLLSMPYMTLMPIFADDILKVGAKGMGVLASLSGIGAMVGSIILASLPNRKRGFILIASSLVLGLALTGFSFSNTWYLSLVLIVFVGLGQSGRMTLGNTLIQYYVKDEYRGRVMSILLMEFGISSFGTFFAAILAGVWGVQWAVGGFASVLVLLSLLAFFVVPRLRKLE